MFESEGERVRESEGGRRLGFPLRPSPVEDVSLCDPGSIPGGKTKPIRWFSRGDTLQPEGRVLVGFTGARARAGKGRGARKNRGCGLERERGRESA